VGRGGTIFAGQGSFLSEAGAGTRSVHIIEEDRIMLDGSK
jgi:hypothetical protein